MPARFILSPDSTDTLGSVGGCIRGFGARFLAMSGVLRGLSVGQPCRTCSGISSCRVPGHIYHLGALNIE